MKFLALIPFYFLGAFPTGLILARLRGVDLTSQGSGNVGATNVARVMGKNLGLLTFLIDLAKGALAVFLGYLLTESTVFSAFTGVSSVAGHCFSIPGKLKGGKGAATSLGVLLALDPLGAAISFGAFLVVVAVFRIVSAGSITAALLAPVVFMFRGHDDLVVLAVSLMAIVTVIRHRANISRLIEGKEFRIRSRPT